MPFFGWLKRSFGRTAEGTRAHLVGTAELFGVDPAILERMKVSSDEEGERLLIESIEGRHGTIADWKASLASIVEDLTCLTEEERAILIAVPAALANERIYKIPREITGLLHPPLRTLRIVETFGDAYFVFLVPSQLVEAFDHINRNWAI
jgi:hypothetical protein